MRLRPRSLSLFSYSGFFRHKSRRAPAPAPARTPTPTPTPARIRIRNRAFANVRDLSQEVQFALVQTDSALTQDAMMFEQHLWIKNGVRAIIRAESGLGAQLPTGVLGCDNEFTEILYRIFSELAKLSCSTTLKPLKHSAHDLGSFAIIQS